jgi:hypothetical protein
MTPKMGAHYQMITVSSQISLGYSDVSTLSSQIVVVSSQMCFDVYPKM